MRVSRVALALVSLLCFAARDARAQSEELENAPAPPMPAPCPVVDSLGASTLHVFEFPALKTSLFDAEHVAPDGSRRPGREGVDQLVELIVRSMRPDCIPIRLVVLTGGADFDSRGTAFEDSVSVSRAFTARVELIEAVETVRSAAVERGEIPDLPVRFSGGGIGTRASARASTEPERRKNRFVQARLVQVVPGPAQTGTETDAGTGSGWVSPAADL
jgi:hypothetical protein